MSLFELELKEELSHFFKYKPHFDFFLKLKKKNKPPNATSKKKIALSKIFYQLTQIQYIDTELYDMFRSKFSLYQKKLFDVFCRGKRKYICIRTRKIFSTPGKGSGRVETTIAQLNFFKFLICENVIERLKKLEPFMKKPKKNSNSPHLKKQILEKRITFDYSAKEFQIPNLWNFSSIV